MFDNPVASAALVCFLTGALASGVARLLPGSWFGSLVPSMVFLTSYVLSYNQIPAFPPLGATSKIFYLVLAATLIGVTLDLRSGKEAATHACLLVAPLLSGAWIGAPRLAHIETNVVLTLLALWLGGAILLWHLHSVSKQQHGGGSLIGTVTLMALLLGFAPIALLGGSSTSLMVSFGAVGGLAANALWDLVWPRHDFGAAAVLGGGIGLLAMVDTVTLITRHIDLVALGLLLLIPIMGQVGTRFVVPGGRIHGRWRELLVGILAASPLVLLVAVLLFRHPGSFMS
jgi:hypothetical protein